MVKNRIFPLLWPLAYTTACTTAQVVIMQSCCFCMSSLFYFRSSFAQYNLIAVLAKMLLQIITDVTEDTASTGRDTGCHQEHVLCQFQLLQATAQAVVSVSLPTDTLTAESTALKPT